MTLYEIDHRIADLLDSETGEVLDLDGMMAIQMEREAKLENTALYIKNLEHLAKSIRDEEIALAERRKATEQKAARLREYLASALEGNTIETARVKLFFRASTSVAVYDEGAMIDWMVRNHADLLKFPPPTVSKIEIGKLLKVGEDVPGVGLEERQNIQIK